MRFELAGSLVHPEPLTIKFNTNQDFDPETYIDMGYSHFDVVCIGAGGGRGGGVDTLNTGTLIRNYGGAGGGGGFHRVRGLLSALSSVCPVVIGIAGTSGTTSSNPVLTTDGGDGGASSFNSTTCRASGGKGGKRAETNSTTDTTNADGGQGGKGDRVIAGGGAEGGLAGIPVPVGPDPIENQGTNGTDGTFFHNVGEGGGGGAGGVGKYGSGKKTLNAATYGGRGAYNPGDTSVYGPGDAPGHDTPSGAQNIVPGAAGGAKASPVNGLPTVYGKSGDPGTVIIRLTAE